MAVSAASVYSGYTTEDHSWSLTLIEAFTFPFVRSGLPLVVIDAKWRVLLSHRDFNLFNFVNLSFIMETEKDGNLRYMKAAKSHSFLCIAQVPPELITPSQLLTQPEFSGHYLAFYSQVLPTTSHTSPPAQARPDTDTFQSPNHSASCYPPIWPCRHPFPK